MKIIGAYLKPVKNKNDLEANIDNVLAEIKNTMMNEMDPKKAEKLCYWLNQWGADYLKNEQNFDYMSLMRYKRGSIVRANFGFKIGSEQGGLHYAVVLDNRNNKSNRVLMVVPIESLPDNKKPEDINEDFEVFLGYGIFKEEIAYVQKQITQLVEKINDLKENGRDYSKESKKLKSLEKELISLQKGSVAQISQTCAMSKIRIYNPRHTGDRYATFKLSDEKLNEIQEKFESLYFERS